MSPQSSQLAEALWTDPWPKRLEFVHAGQSPLKRKEKKKEKGKECRQGMICQTFFSHACTQAKATGLKTSANQPAN